MMQIPAYAWILSAVFGVLVSWWAYRLLWSKSTAWKLAALLRFFLVFVLTLILFNPSWKSVFSEKKKARWDVYLDWSQSAFSDTTSVKGWLDSLMGAHPEVDFEVFVFAEDVIRFERRHHLLGTLSRLDLALESIQTRKPQTQLSLLLSDGIQNQGRLISSYGPENIGPIWTIGLGDTSLQKDVYVKDMLSNRDVFAGNSTELDARVEAKVANCIAIKIEWLADNRVLKSEVWIPDSNKELKRFGFTLKTDAKSNAWLNVKVRAARILDEVNLSNNEKTALIQVRDRKKNIDIVYGSPHPDIKALQMAIKEKEAYQVRVYSEQEALKLDADVYVAHGIKSVPNLERLKKTEKPIWWFVNTNSILKELLPGSEAGLLRRGLNGFQEAMPSVNANFESFEMPEESAIYKLWGSVEVPLLALNLAGNKVQLYQVWDGVKTQVPLMWTQKTTQAEHVFMGTGIWKWRLNEFRKNTTANTFDAWITRNIQWLSRTSESKKGWEFYAGNSMLSIGEKSKLKWVYYDESGEKRIVKGINAYATIQGKKKWLPLFLENQEYTALYTAEGSGTVSFSLEDEKAQVLHQSLVYISPTQVEMEQTQAQHQSLKELARMSGGVYGNFISRQGCDYSSLDGKNFGLPVLRSTEKFKPWEQHAPLIFLLIGVFIGEWLLRKWLGKI
jgi:hypothetical protein